MQSQSGRQACAKALGFTINEEKVGLFMDQDIYLGLCGIAGREQVAQNEPMSRHTTFRIGGPADYFVTPADRTALCGAVRFCRSQGVPFYVLGNGSNLLVGDGGYRGVIIQVYRNFNAIQVEGEHIRAQAGATLPAIAKQALEHGLSGFEFASGIPGTLGGAAVMNAGAYGRELKDVLQEALVLTPEGSLRTLSCQEMDFGYRASVVSKAGYLVLEAVLRLQRGDPQAIRARMEELKEQRTSKQPLDLPSAGSTFKRPEGYFAGKLIMDAGLRGFRVGGAQVSEKHCGFIVNRGGASAADVRELIRQVTARVWEASGVLLEPEVKMLGEF